MENEPQRLGTEETRWKLRRHGLQAVTMDSAQQSAASIPDYASRLAWKLVSSCPDQLECSGPCILERAHLCSKNFCLPAVHFCKAGAQAQGFVHVKLKIYTPTPTTCSTYDRCPYLNS